MEKRAPILHRIIFQNKGNLLDFGVMKTINKVSVLPTVYDAKKEIEWKTKHLNNYLLSIVDDEPVIMNE